MNERDKCRKNARRAAGWAPVGRASEKKEEENMACGGLCLRCTSYRISIGIVLGSSVAPKERTDAFCSYLGATNSYFGGNDARLVK